jgi:hypothetical protein
MSRKFPLKSDILIIFSRTFKINWNLLLELDNSPFSSQFKWFQYWKLYCKWLKTENKTKVNIKVLLNMINISLFNGNLRLIYHPYLSTSLILFSTWRPYSPFSVTARISKDKVQLCKKEHKTCYSSWKNHLIQHKLLIKKIQRWIVIFR